VIFIPYIHRQIENPKDYLAFTTPQFFRTDPAVVIPVQAVK
jgi:hypothetical protein